MVWHAMKICSRALVCRTDATVLLHKRHDFHAGSPESFQTIDDLRRFQAENHLEADFAMARATAKAVLILPGIHLLHRYPGERFATRASARFSSVFSRSACRHSRPTEQTDIFNVKHPPSGFVCPSVMHVKTRTQKRFSATNPLANQGTLRHTGMNRRGGRVAEGAPLLREYTRDGIEGSNPFLSATAQTRAFLAHGLKCLLIMCGIGVNPHSLYETIDKYGSQPTGPPERTMEIFMGTGGG